MTLVARPCQPGAAGVDTIEQITPAIASCLRAAGKQFVMRYGLGLSAEEVAAITDAGLGLGVVSFGRHTDFSAATGAGDAEAILEHLRAIGVPLGLTIGVDLEDPAGAQLADLLVYEAAFARTCATASCTAGVYVGAGLGMSSAELYGMSATRYWKSGSRIVDLSGHVAEPACGWCLVQGLPFNQHCGGASVDYDFSLQDFRGRSWWMLYASAAGSIPLPFPVPNTDAPPPNEDTQAA